MKRHDFNHVIAAAAEIVGDDEIVVIGSQAILGEFPEAPASLTTSIEVDIYPLSDPEQAIQIDGAIGEGSLFHQQYGYYAHGVGPETPTAPAGWEGRRVKTAVPGLGPRGRPATAWCMSAPDLVLAKLAAGRSHDFDFAEEALKAGLVDLEQLRLGIELMPSTAQEQTRERLAIVVARLPN